MGLHWESVGPDGKTRQQPWALGNGPPREAGTPAWPPVLSTAPLGRSLPVCDPELQGHPQTWQGRPDLCQVSEAIPTRLLGRRDPPPDDPGARGSGPLSSDTNTQGGVGGTTPS